MIKCPKMVKRITLLVFIKYYKVAYNPIVNIFCERVILIKLSHCSFHFG